VSINLSRVKTLIIDASQRGNLVSRGIIVADQADYHRPGWAWEMSTYVMALRYLKGELSALCLTWNRFSNTQSFPIANQYNFYETFTWTREKACRTRSNIFKSFNSLQREDMHL
jgi:hypothetical protein